MIFHSILYENQKDDIKEETILEPDFFSDVLLDQIVHTITADFEEYNLKPFFYHSLKSIGEITYRHQIMQELGDARVHEVIRSFSNTMQAMRKDLVQAEKLYYPYQKKSWFLDAVELYCESVTRLVHDLTPLNLKSRGLSSFLEYLIQYTWSHDFTTLVAEIKELKTALARVRYCLIINGGTVTVRKYESEVDYRIEVDKTFERFRQGAVQYYQGNFPDNPEMNHVEANILNLVAQLYPDIFSRLDRFHDNHVNYLDMTIGRFDREIQFYFAYLEFVTVFQKTGLWFCIPEVSNTSKEVCNSEGFDLALAIKLVQEKKPVICNDFYLKDNERIFVITGPNQGGKTTFARTFGQLHHLASLGCPVPGRSARLYLFDRLFTHFEREEDIDNLRSKLEDDLVRIHDIVTVSTSRSIIIINEMFTSTTIQDALFLGRKVLGHAQNLDLLCIYVTFLDELTSLEKSVSMVSCVVPENPDLRTYKIERKPADGLSYAHAIARKNRLTYEDIMERVQS